MKGVYGQSRPRNPRMNALTRLQSTKTNKNAKGDPLRCSSSHKMDQLSLTSKGMFLLLRYSIQTVVYLGTKLLGRSHESLDAASPFQRTLYSLPPGVSGSGLTVRILSAVKLSSSPSSSESRSPAVN